MAITTLDGALAGMKPVQFFDKVLTTTLVAGRPFSLWNLAGIPGAGLVPATTAGGVVLSSTSALVNGQIPHYDPSAGPLSYLARFSANSQVAGTVELVDRLWHAGGNSAGAALSPTLTTAQTINSAAWPARDINGASAGGDGVRIALEVLTTLGAGTPTFTLTYTNQSGTAGRTATNIITVVAASAVGSFYEFGLQAGDTGVRSIQSLTLSATATSGTFALVAYRPLAQLEIVSVNISNSLDLLSGGFVQLYDGTVPALLFTGNATTAAQVSGSYIEAQG